VSEVEIRRARVGDGPAVARVWSSAVPYLVRAAGALESEIGHDERDGRRRRVAVEDREVVGSSLVRRTSPGNATVNVVVDPDSRRHGVGAALLEDALGQMDGVTTVNTICNGPGLAFAEKRGFENVGLHQISRVDPGTVHPPGPPPDSLQPVRCDRLPDLQSLLDTHNLSAPDDPSGQSGTYDMAHFRAAWWDAVGNAPELSWALLDDEVVASFSNVQVDRGRGRAWSGMTATHPAYRGRGLAIWVKRRTLSGLVDAGVIEAWTANDSANLPMLAVNRSLGYQPAATAHLARKTL
jgi:GNAT superfamily N-acetyltransferase